MNLADILQPRNLELILAIEVVVVIGWVVANLRSNRTGKRQTSRWMHKILAEFNL